MSVWIPTILVAGNGIAAASRSGAEDKQKRRDRWVVINTSMYVEYKTTRELLTAMGAMQR